VLPTSQVIVNISVLGEEAKVEALWRLSCACYWLGMLSKEKGERVAYFKEGMAWGKRAVQGDTPSFRCLESLNLSPNPAAPDRVESNTWYIANMGMHGEISVLWGLIYMLKIEKYLVKAMETDSRYENGLPTRLLGRFYQGAYPWPFGPADKTKARVLLERALSFGKSPFQYLDS